MGDRLQLLRLTSITASIEHKYTNKTQTNVPNIFSILCSRLLNTIYRSYFLLLNFLLTPSSMATEINCLWKNNSYKNQITFLNTPPPPLPSFQCLLFGGIRSFIYLIFFLFNPFDMKLAFYVEKVIH